MDLACSCCRRLFTCVRERAGVESTRLTSVPVVLVSARVRYYPVWLDSRTSLSVNPFRCCRRSLVDQATPGSS